PLIFMSTAELNWFTRNYDPQKQKPRTLGSATFASRKTGRANEANRSARNLSERLHHVSVQENATFPTDFRDFAQRLNYAGFIVRVHNRDEHGLVSNRIGQLIQIDEAVF